MVAPSSERREDQVAGFMNKQQIREEAERLGIDLTGMTWQQQQQAVSKALRGEDPTVTPTRKQAEQAELERLRRELAEAKAQASAVPQVPVVFDLGPNHPEPTIEDYENAVLMAAPMQQPTQYQKQKYYEQLGEEKLTEEIHLDVGKFSPFGPDEDGLRTKTYRVVDTGRPVVATSTMPKYGCMLTWRPTKDLCAVATYGNHRGYLWTHQRLPNVKGLLQQMGVYEEYKDLWAQGNGRIFYLGGLLCVDVPFTDETFRRIQAELKRRAKRGE